MHPWASLARSATCSCECVARDNPARRLYARLGFTPVAGAGTGTQPYLALEWRPGPREG
ncbi:hypothetical protein [Hyalangium sp.]|uniref:hypothetical protein n=1 Tax=Hyalangium sp. TaxID=2028555 RepID=UPI003899F454